MAEDKHIVQLMIVHVKPKYYMSYLQSIPKGVELLKKHGGHPIHQWIVEAGGGPEVIFLNRFESLDAKLACNEAMMKDPEFQAFMKENARKIYSMDPYVCMRVPIFPINKVDDNTKVVIEIFDCKQFPVYCAGKMKEGIEFVNSKLGEYAQQPAAVLLPLAYKDFGMIAIWKNNDNNKWDGIFNKWGEMMKDPHNWPKLAAGHHLMSEKSVRFCRPFKADQIPKEA